MKSLKLIVSVSLLLIAATLIGGFTAKTDTVIQGRVIEVPCEMKIISIQYANRKPMVVMREMREGEQPEVWILKPLDELEGEPAGGDATTIVRECSQVIRK